MPLISRGASPEALLTTHARLSAEPSGNVNTSWWAPGNSSLGHVGSSGMDTQAHTQVRPRKRTRSGRTARPPPFRHGRSADLLEIMPPVRKKEPLLPNLSGCGAQQSRHSSCRDQRTPPGRARPQLYRPSGMTCLGTLWNRPAPPVGARLGRLHHSSSIRTGSSARRSEHAPGMGSRSAVAFCKAVLRVEPKARSPNLGISKKHTAKSGPPSPMPGATDPWCGLWAAARIA
jgi:hypothetical protein